jgi:hypothetical protein
MRALFSSSFRRCWLGLPLALLGWATFAAPPAAPKSPLKNAREASLSAKDAGAEEPLQQCNPGPWGKLQYSYFFLEAPDHLLATVPVPNSSTRWFFPGANLDSLRALFDRARLPAEMQNRLLDPKRMLSEASALTLFPAAADLDAMAPEMRTVIYPELAKFASNEYYQNPVYFPGGGVEEWLRDAKLRPELQAVIRKMSYPLGRVQAFSDVGALLQRAQSDAEARRIVKVTTRSRCLMAHLRIDPGDDAKALANYWSANEENSDILPLLESAAERSCCSTELDVTHLLPPLARRWAYTYPGLFYARQGRLPDCHWTTLNFFNITPQQYYRDTRLASQRVIEAYTPIAAPYRFGDALLFLDSHGNAVHSCVFIADDIVFTKDGENILQPWSLQKLDGVKQIYLREDSWRVQGYRPKTVAAQ